MAERFGFLLLPGYSMLAFTGAVDQMRMANRITQKTLYEWVIVTGDGKPVKASNGLRVYTDYAIKDVDEFDVVFVCGGIDIEPDVDRDIRRWLIHLDRKHIPLGSMCTGSHVLAMSGLLKNHRCTIHWENMSFFRETYPDLIISREVFVIDRGRYTCAGGTSSMDLLVALIAKKHGWELAGQIAEGFLVERIRGRNDRQKYPLKIRLGASQPRLIEAAALMEANVEEPISLGEIALRVGVTKRQLERLFRKHLHTVPGKYYLKVRLTRARELLIQSGMRIYDIAIATGFVSGPHFSKCYRDNFGVSPSEERNSHANGITHYTG